MNAQTTKPLTFNTIKDAVAYCFANDINPMMAKRIDGAFLVNAYGAPHPGVYIVNKLIGTYRACSSAGVLCA